MRFGAYITVGSPNGGAPIIVSANNGETGRLMTEIVNELSAGPQSASIMAQIFNKTIEEFKGFIAKTLADAITNSFISNTTKDFAYGANWITTLNSATPTNTPRVHIVGIETAPMHWKTISSYVLNSGAGLAFGQTNDTEMEDKINQLRANYVSKVNYKTPRHPTNGQFGMMVMDTSRCAFLGSSLYNGEDRLQFKVIYNYQLNDKGEQILASATLITNDFDRQTTTETTTFFNKKT